MDYVKYIRGMVSHNKIIMNAAGGIIAKDNKTVKIVFWALFLLNK